MSPENSHNPHTLLQSQDRDLYMCALCVPEPKRTDILAILSLYAELLHIPKLVSEEMLGHIRLAWWREAFEAIQSGHVSPRHEALQALEKLDNRHFSEWFRLLDALACDLQQTPFSHADDAWRYALDLGGALGEIITHIEGADISQAKNVGAAWTILRLIREQRLLPDFSPSAISAWIKKIEAEIPELPPSRQFLYYMRLMIDSRVREIKRVQYDISRLKPHQGRARRALRLWISCLLNVS